MTQQRGVSVVIENLFAQRLKLIALWSLPPVAMQGNLPAQQPEVSDLVVNVNDTSVVCRPGDIKRDDMQIAIRQDF
jgi:hypothetical protein